MCGRFTLISNNTLLENQFSVINSYIDTDYTSYNITPSSNVPIVHLDKYNNTTLSMMSWGLIPIWIQNFRGSVNRPINARIETLEQKVSFREAYNKRRCLVVASGFYEWNKNSNSKQPYYFYLPDNKLMAFAGIWNYHATENEQKYSFAIITKDANSQVINIHQRMPVMIDKNSYKSWLENGQITLASENLLSHLVSTNVGNPKNNNASLMSKIY